MSTDERKPGPRVAPDETDDIGYREDEEERAYERAQPDSQPTVDSDPEPDSEPANTG